MVLYSISYLKSPLIALHKKSKVVVRKMMNIRESILDPKNSALDATQIAQELNNLQKQLKQLNSWPAAGDDFLALIPKTDNAAPITAKENEWLQQVIEACMIGTDIGFRYPSFFQKLLINSTLRQAFMEQLTGKMEARDLI